MPFIPIFSTGFEMGSLPALQNPIYLPYITFTGANVANITIQTSPAPKSGTYILRMYEGNEMWVTFASQSEIYVSCWFYPDSSWGTNGYTRWAFVISDGNYLAVQWNQTNKRFDAYVNAGSVANGSVIIAGNSWIHLQIHFKIADAGLIETRVNGAPDIIYAGDTKPGVGITGTILKIIKQAATGQWSEYDDVVIGTTDWAGDIRHIALPVNSDAGPNQWDSTGVNDWSVLDERPLSTADYIYTPTNAEEAIHGLTDTSVNADPKWVHLWWHLNKSSANASQKVKFIDSDGVNTNKSAATEMSMGSYHYIKLLTSAPDAGVWTIAKINSLLMGIESVIT